MNVFDVVAEIKTKTKRNKKEQQQQAAILELQKVLSLFNCIYTENETVMGLARHLASTSIKRYLWSVKALNE